MQENDQAREARLRRAAKKEGLLLQKSRKKTSIRQRGYYLFDERTRIAVHTATETIDGMLTIEEAEARLDYIRKRRL